MKWSPLERVLPRDSEFAVLTIEHLCPQIRIVQPSPPGSEHMWIARGHRTQYPSWVADRVLRGDGVAWWASVADLPTKDDPKGWGLMAMAPRDGTPFWRLQEITHIGSGITPYVSLEACLLWRCGVTEDSEGCWDAGWGSMDDYRASYGFWSRDLLPISPDHYKARRLQERADHAERVRLYEESLANTDA